MNPYERFFRLLWTLLGMVVSTAATIEWLDDCFEAIIKNPEAPDLPRRIRSSRRFNRDEFKGRIRRQVVSWDLSPSDWKLLLEFCKNKNPRFLSLVEYFHSTGNAPTTRKVLEEKGFIFQPFNRYDVQVGVNTPLLKAEINIGLRVYHKIGRHFSIEDKMRFCILKVL